MEVKKSGIVQPGVHQAGEGASNYANGKIQMWRLFSAIKGFATKYRITVDTKHSIKSAMFNFLFCLHWSCMLPCQLHQLDAGPQPPETGGKGFTFDALNIVIAFLHYSISSSPVPYFHFLLSIFHSSSLFAISS